MVNDCSILVRNRYSFIHSFTHSGNDTSETKLPKIFTVVEGVMRSS